tara:strand:+ start:796 stop:975 length:180 start_codon:yes stop_codon:yes gene_type:complete
MPLTKNSDGNIRREYRVLIDKHGETFVLAEDDMDAAYSAADLANKLNAKLVDVFPHEKN